MTTLVPRNSSLSAAIWYHLPWTWPWHRWREGSLSFSGSYMLERRKIERETESLAKPFLENGQMWRGNSQNLKLIFWTMIKVQDILNVSGQALTHYQKQKLLHDNILIKWQEHILKHKNDSLFISFFLLFFLEYNSFITMWISYTSSWFLFIYILSLLTFFTLWTLNFI